MHDVVVVGGSVAGAAAAGFLAREGLRVVVLDAAAFPRAKACGEGLLPPGVRVLERLGVSLPGASTVGGIRFQVGPAAARLPFPSGHGLAVSRWELDQAIRERSAALGARFERARVLGVAPPRVMTDGGEFRAPVVIGADGVRSVFHRSLGIPVRVVRDRIGLTTHWRGARCEPELVDVIAFPGGELYVAPLGDPASGPGLSLAALLMDRRLGVRRRNVEGFLRERFPDRFAEARMEGPVLGAYPLGSKVSRVAGPGWLLVGDAAGMVDPISGEGMSLALQGAELAARAVLSGSFAHASGKGFAAYPRDLGRVRRPIVRLTSALLTLSRHPRLARVVLRREERLAPLMRVAVGESGLLSRVVGW